MDNIILSPVYHNHELWEDWKSGMYKLESSSDDLALKEKSIMLLSNRKLLYECMKYVAFNWKYSAEHNLTKKSRNRQAWLGQAACCYNHGASENITKKAWNELPENTQNEANVIARKVLKLWDRKQIEKSLAELQLKFNFGE